MPYKSFNIKTRKLNKIWQQAEVNNADIKKNKEFKPITVDEVILHTNKLITRVQILDNTATSFSGSVPLEGFTEQMLEFVYPLATFNVLSPEVTTEDITIFDGTFYYWFQKINDTNYNFQFTAGVSVDVNQGFGINLSLVFLNKRIYDNLQKKRK